MSAQQLQVDTISNNLANVNTTGYKRERQEFSTLFYDTLNRANLDPANPPGRPVNLQVGLGVRPVATTRYFNQGSLQRTDRPLDVALNGPGFFMVRRSYMTDDNEIIGYTRDGAFQVSPNEDGELMIVTALGFPILDIEGEPVVLPSVEDGGPPTDSHIIIGLQGIITWMDPEAEDNSVITHDQQIAVVRFPNQQGLEGIGNNLFVSTAAAGEPIMLATDPPGFFPASSGINQGVLEMSNVNIATEMISLITSQRAFELNSRAISTSDQMLQEAVNLRR